MNNLDFTKLLKTEYGLNKKDFAELSHIKHGSVINWGTSQIPNIPEWVIPFLELYKKSLQYDELIKDQDKLNTLKSDTLKYNTLLEKAEIYETIKKDLLTTIQKIK